MSFREDRQGLESLPLKLMIVAIVASLSIVPAARALENLRNRDFAMRTELQLDTIVSAAQMLMIEGPGGVRTISSDFDNEGKLKFERLVIGDRDGGPNMSSTVLRFTTGATMVKTATEPPLWMRGSDGLGVVAASPTFDLRMSVELEGSTPFVLVEVM